MAKNRNALPQLGHGVFLCYTGMETDLIFNRGIDLPGFASYPLPETDRGRGRAGRSEPDMKEPSRPATRHGIR